MSAWKSPLWIAECAYRLRKLGNDAPIRSARYLYDAYFSLGIDPEAAISIDREYWE